MSIFATMDKNTIINVIYTLIWSLGLLFVSFLPLFKGGSLDFSTTPLEKFGETYMFPLTMSMCLFSIDVVYSFFHKRIWAVPIISCIALFILTIGITVAFVQCYLCTVVSFIIGWISLTLMKYITLCISEGDETQTPTDMVEDK